METRQVDVAIIGAGTAGMGAYRGARQATDNVALIEGGPYGTTCARVGCMPSKLLIAAAEAVHAIHEAPGFGVHPNGAPRIDGKQVMQRVRSERDRFVGFVLESVNEFEARHKIRGYARFLDDHTLQVDDHTRITAKAIVIATGSSPAIPPILLGAGERLVTNDAVFDWPDLPASVAVFGPGVIGLELGQALHRLGVKLFILGRGGFMATLSDPAVRDYAIKTFGEELYLDTDAHVTEVRQDETQVVVRFRGLNGEERVERVDYVLAATGRTANVKNLGLENTGLKLDARGVPLFNRFTLQCGESSIFIAGDVNNDRPLLHEAADEGRIAGENAGRPDDIRAGHRRAPLSVVFCDPQIAMAGYSHRELKSGTFATGVVSFEDQGRSRVMLKNKGLMHVYGEYGSGLFLGAEMFGPRAEHLGHLLSWAFQQKLTVAQMLEMPFYHPVIEEGLRTALRDLSKKLHMGPPVVKNCIDCGPGA